VGRLVRCPRRATRSPSRRRARTRGSGMPSPRGDRSPPGSAAPSAASAGGGCWSHERADRPDDVPADRGRVKGGAAPVAQPAVTGRVGCTAPGPGRRCRSPPASAAPWCRP
jgi:hypothetical protein